MLRKILRVAGIIVLLIGIALGALVGFGFYANRAAEQAANTFCGKIPAGSDIDLAVARAGREGVRYRVINDKTTYDFVFQGWVFNAGVCRAIVANGKVTALRSGLEGD